MDFDALILANGADYLLRKLVDRAVCKASRSASRWA